MSAALTAFTRKLPRRSRTPTLEPLRVRIFVWAVIIPTVSLLTTLSVLQWRSITEALPNLIMWLAVVTAAELLPILYSEEVNITLSMPLLLAAGIVLAPIHAGLIGFLGSWDGRHLRREITWSRALFNRSQIALSSFFGSLVFHSLGGNIRVWPLAVWACLAASLADMIINVALVSVAAALMARVKLTKVLSDVALDSPWSFAFTYLSLAPIAALIALTTSHYGGWGLVAASVPLILARQVFVLLKRGAEAKAEVRVKEELVREISQRIAEERQDERARLAMDLHDEALAALYQVHLMGEVLRQDLSHGKLFELEVDVPKLKAATVQATEALRALIRNLRKSPVGAHGLTRTLNLLVEETSGRTSAEIHADVRPVAASASIQLLVYQVAREALENAIRHARAQNIYVFLFEDDDAVRLVVRDDGTGFVITLSDRELHFGLRMMAERAQLAGGVLHIDSRLGEGTQITGRFPLAEP